MMLEELFAMEKDLLTNAKQSQIDDLFFNFTSIVQFARLV